MVAIASGRHCRQARQPYGTLDVQSRAPWNNGLDPSTMRERITFVHGANDFFKLEQLQLDNDTLHVESLKAAREDRLTFGLHELPQEVSSFHLG
jgi:hypothetical protein